MSKQYNFFCVICGEPFSAAKKHARCCSSECRVVLSNVMRYEVTDDEFVKEAVVKEEVAEKYEKTTGKELNPKVLSKHPERKKENDEEVVSSKILKRKKNPKVVDSSEEA